MHHAKTVCMPCIYNYTFIFTRTIHVIFLNVRHARFDNSLFIGLTYFNASEAVAAYRTRKAIEIGLRQIFISPNQWPPMKKALGETRTLCAGRSNAEPKYFAPLHADPFPGGAGRPKFNQLDGIQTQFGEDRSTQFRVIVATDPYTQTTPAMPARCKHTDRTDNNTLRR